MFERILIATDGSAGSRAAVDEGLAFARPLGASVLFVTVRHAPMPVLGDPYYQRALTGEQARCASVIDQALAAAKAAGVPAEGEILEGHPADLIVGLARSRNADLIVVGSRGHGALASAVLGSVSRRVVHEADRPVLVVKEGAALQLELTEEDRVQLI